MDWALKLVPRGGGGSYLKNPPADLIRQLDTFDLPPGSHVERLKVLIEKHDPAQSCYEEVVKRLPSPIRDKLEDETQVAVGLVHDAEFNGSVIRSGRNPDDGHVILVPVGGYMLTAYASELCMLAAPPMLTLAISEAGAAYVGQAQTRTMRLARGERLFRWARTAGPRRSEMAEALELLFRRYVALGVADPPDILRTGMRIPLVTDQARIGHPLEAGSYLTHFAREFLILHECGHIILGHFGPSSLQGEPAEIEFAADRWALEMIAESSPTKQYKMCGLVGAAALLSFSARIEKLENSQSTGTHPSAARRIQRLLDFVRTSPRLGFWERMRAWNCITKFLQMASSMQAYTDRNMPSFQSLRGNAFTWLLDTSCETQGDLAFKDQVPRWVSQAIPERFCMVLSVERVCTERRLRQAPDDIRLRRRLELILWVFEGVKSGHSRAEIFLDEAYEMASRTAAH